MTDEEIYTEADKRYPRRWSGDAENGNNSDKFIEGAEWAREKLTVEACEWLKRELAEPMPDELYQQWCSEKLEDFIKAMKRE